jgi:hypothetical protein
MSTRYRLDRESFEKFLANALEVQKSGLDPKSLSALVETQQLIANDRFDTDQLMQSITDRVLKLFNASGAAIALLDGNKLVYRTGAGNAASDVGRHVGAVLNISSSGDKRREILRVENAETDARIQAEICRQFGARSLLILPVCDGDALIGVMQVLFDDAHEFADREVRVYRLMIGALEQSLSRDHLSSANQQEMKTSAVQAVPQSGSDRDFGLVQNAVNTPRITDLSVTKNVFQGQPATNAALTDGAPSQTAQRDEAPALEIVRRRCEVYWSLLHQDMKFLFARLRAAIGSPLNTTSRPMLWRASAALTATLVLLTVTFLFDHNHPSTSPRGSSAATPPVTGQSSPINPPATNEPVLSDERSSESVKRSSGLRRVKISPNEVDYIAEDVTMRTFTISSPKRQPPKGVKEVDFGDDVTVRYFANDVSPSRPSPKSDADSSADRPKASPR